MPAKRRGESRRAVGAKATTKATPEDSLPTQAGSEEQGAAVAEISDARLTRLFSRPRSPKQMLAGLRALGFTADSVKLMTSARSRDVVYSWAAGRARPGVAQAQRLDEIRRALYFICRHEELGAESAWMLFNAKFADMDLEGPTAMELIARGDPVTVMDNLEKLVDDEHGGGPPPGDDPPPDPPAPRSPGTQTVGSGL